jgi:hypothetical protein
VSGESVTLFAPWLLLWRNVTLQKTVWRAGKDQSHFCTAALIWNPPGTEISLQLNVDSLFQELNREKADERA